MQTIRRHWLLFLLSAAAVALLLSVLTSRRTQPLVQGEATPDTAWQAPSIYLDQSTWGRERAMVIYGRELVANTARYLGPKGTVLHTSNGMNCQNCHLDAGSRSWGNNFGAVAANYPRLRERSGKVEDVYQRINDCFERSLNGQPLDRTSYELQSIAAYINWLGQDVPKGRKPYGTGLEKLRYLDRAADPGKGRLVFENNCRTCHGTNGEGQLLPDGTGYAFPPLWGPHSYNDGAGLYRLSGFAGFVKNNMPFNQSSHAHPTLTDEEAWDVAAFVNSQPRPHKDQGRDWPDVAKKPVDFPFGPYADSFPEQQHKYGPFLPIEAARKQTGKNLIVKRNP